jgi:hypothetical protein
MNRTQLLQLSADLDRVIELRSYDDEDESHLLRNTAIAGTGAAGIAGGLYAQGRRVQNAGMRGLSGGALETMREVQQKDGVTGAMKVGWRNVSDSIGGIRGNYKLDRALAKGIPASAGVDISRLGSLKEAGKKAWRGIRHLSAKTDNLLTLSAELDQVINFDWMDAAKKFAPSIGKAALKWGGIGAAGGAVAGGVSGALSDDPNQSAIGGAFKGAAAGGLLGAAGGAGMQGMKINSAFKKAAALKSARLGGAAPKVAAAAPAATAAATPMAAAPSQVAGVTTHGSAAYPNTSVADALAAKKAAAAAPAAQAMPAGVMPRGADQASRTSAAYDPSRDYKKNPYTYQEAERNNTFSSRLQSLVQLSAELDSVLTT